MTVAADPRSGGTSPARIADAAEAVDRADTTASGLTYRPGLDGLRGLAVLAVVAFHAGVGLPGGYLAVSTFFTLSGFLITLLLLGERSARGSVAVGAFWERRIRRLLPAAGLGVALAALVTALVGSPDQRRAIGWDSVTTLADVANWRFVAVDRSYGQLFEAPSALQHAWSLAIEAQFYWLYPLLFVVVMRAVRGDRRRFAAVLALLAAGSLAVTRFAGFSADRIYYGTDTRAAELLAGALAACVVAGRRARPERGRAGVALDVASAIGLLALIAAWVLTPAGATWLGEGGLGVYAAVGAVVVVGAFRSGTAVARLLGAEPLRRLGRISYGVYLFHWPVLLLLAPERVPGPPLARAAVALAVTLGLASASFRWVELPVRTRTPPLGRLGLRSVVVGVAVVALVPSVLVTRGAPPATALDHLAAGALLDDTASLGAPAGAPPTAVVDPGDPADATDDVAAPSAGPLVPAPFAMPSRPLRVVVVGDSVAYELAPLLEGWGAPRGVWEVASHARIGCGIVRGGVAHGPIVNPEFGPECRVWPQEWPALIDTVQPDAVVLAGGFWDAIDRRVGPDQPWRGPGDPAYDSLILDEYRQAVVALAGTGVPLLWLDHPPVAPSPGGAVVANPADYDPTRMRRLDEIQAEAAADQPSVRIIRTMDFYRAWPGGVMDPALRPDGMHVTGPGAEPLIEWLGPELVDAYWSVRGAEGEAPG